MLKIYQYSIFIEMCHHPVLRDMLIVDEVYQILIDSLMGETIIHLEFFSEMLRPVFETEIVRKEDNLSAYELLHHLVR